MLYLNVPAKPHADEMGLFQRWLNLQCVNHGAMLGPRELGLRA